jgi:pyruvate dehydrogenase E2 component (dihydrolipoamide acetyltransferase)
MPIKITMPALSPTMTEGTLARWVKKEGDSIKSGEIIAEIETDKATMEFEAVDEGVLGKIVVSEGTEGVAVNALIGWLLEEGESASAIPADAAEAPTAAPAAAEPAAAAPAAAAPAASAPAPAAAASSGRPNASPLARRVAKDAGVDLGAIKGSGPNGRIVRADVEAAKSAPKPAAAAPAAPAPKPVEAPAKAAAVPGVPAGPDAKALADTYGIPYTEQANNGMRKTIARRLTESKQTVPHFYLTVDCEIDALLGLRKQLNERHDLKVSVNDYIIKAVALALKKVPEANASWTDKAVLLYGRADISVAVATPGGLITPIIKDASNKGLSTISAEMKDLAGRARDNKLKPEEFQGGTFSISNLGMFGVKQFEAIVNPPQGCILAVGAGEQRAVVKGGALAVATVMTVTLSVDHRVVDGAVGAQFLKAFKAYIEDPTSMLL